MGIGPPQGCPLISLPVALRIEMEQVLMTGRERVADSKHGQIVGLGKKSK